MLHVNKPISLLFRALRLTRIMNFPSVFSRRPIQVDVDKDEDEQRRKKLSYAWESSKIRSWEQIEEDPETGRLKSYVREEQIARKRIRDDGLSGIRRGIIRYCVVILDMSSAVRANDMKPSRADVACEALIDFVKEFFDQNPISQLCIVVTKDGEAVKFSSFSANEKHHIEAVQKALRLGANGNASLQNALNVARKNLESVPPYAMKESIVCYGSLSTCDPGDIHATIESLVTDKIRCSAVGMGAELHILRLLSKKTRGTYIIAMNEDHFRDSLSAHVIPPPTTTKQTSASLIRMGYPILQQRKEPAPYCNNPSLRGRLGYACPRCTAWLSDMPSECTLCGLTLVSSPHLARSYHHLFPVPKYLSLGTTELTAQLFSGAGDAEEKLHRATMLSNAPNARCTGCARLLDVENALRLLCPRCVNVFCLDCDSFVHDSLHHCPGCGTQNT